MDSGAKRSLGTFTCDVRTQERRGFAQKQMKVLIGCVIVTGRRDRKIEQFAKCIYGWPLNPFLGQRVCESHESRPTLTLSLIMAIEVSIKKPTLAGKLWT